ncbi:monocarboxylate transporter 10-like [Brevipalpus obovatus]|uniref:monocarboxylate transporter 10-like n=1 Tax=Brevipalpus obovatus TaxID=246614 RepID=UPI003D9EAF18
MHSYRQSTGGQSKRPLGSRVRIGVRKLLGHRSWLIVLASFLTNGIIFGVINSFGVIYVYLHDLFKSQTEDAAFHSSLVGSLLSGITFLCSALSTVITDRFGIRSTAFIGGLLATVGMLTASFASTIYELYLTLGLILGFGVSLCYAPSLVILGHYFTSNLGLVNGIVTAGSSTFTVILPICLKYLLERFSLYITLRILSMLMSVLMICALTFKENDEYTGESGSISKESSSPSTPTSITPLTTSSSERLAIQSKDQLNTHSNSSPKQLINREIWHNTPYVLWAISVPIALLGYFVPAFHLPKHVKDTLPGSNSELLVTCIGATSGIGRIIFGQVADMKNVNPIILQQIALLVFGIVTMLLVVAKSFPVLIALCALFGIFDGCFVSLMGPVAYRLVGKKGASQAIGFVFGLSSIPFSIGPPVAGYLYDVYGNYFLAFLLAGIPPFIGASLMIPIVVIQRRQQKQQERLLESENKPETWTPYS